MTRPVDLALSVPAALTVLHAPGRRLAKQIRQNGIVDSYEGTKHFHLTECPLFDLDDLAEALT